MDISVVVKLYSTNIIHIKIQIGKLTVKDLTTLIYSPFAKYTANQLGNKKGIAI